VSHNLGRLVPVERTFNQTTGLDLKPPGDPPRFVILHFDSVNLSPGAKLTVDLGYGTDVFTANSGTDFWSRPVDGSISSIPLRITGGTGSARLREYGRGEPSGSQGGEAPGSPDGSMTNPDPFLHTNPYQEPEYETRVRCGTTFDWLQAACSLGDSVPDPVKDRVAAAVGIIVEVHDHDVHGRHLSSCSGTLIGADLFLTSRHCLNDREREDLRSASVTFDYVTACDRTKPSGHVTRFFKVIEDVASGSPPTGMQISGDTDWVVVRLDAAPGSLPQRLEMRDAAPMNGETVFTMHHPNGAAKKTQAGVFGTTGFDFAGGSSGSALFDVNGHLVRGPLSVGDGCFTAFAPVGPIKAALQNPPAPAVPLDVMVVFDRSGSMSSPAPPVGRTKREEAQDAAALFVQLVREGQGDRLGLVTFSSQASLDQAMGLAAATKPALVGPPPFTTGEVGAIAAGGATSIGAGLGIALLGFGSGSGNERAILLLSDGLQNTVPMVEEVEGHLGATRLNVIGFGSDADIDGPLLTRVARDHGGHFTRAVDGLALRKFFGLSFGNIFESGALSDPESLLHANQAESSKHPFTVCGEERITVVLGWDEPSTPLRAHIRTPNGTLVSERRVRPVRGRSWVFWKIPLPHEGERDGTWHFTVERIPTGGEFPPPPTDVRYFFLVVCSGGPKLFPLLGPRHLYTGDPVDPLVALHYADRTKPRKAELELFIDAPGVALGQLTTQAGLHAPATSGDAVDAFHATLQSIAQAAGGALPIPRSTIRVPLFDDGSHNDGAMEPDGIFNNRLKDLTRVEGTYEFRAVATYGEGCRATREALWSVHVEPGIDPDRSTVTLVDVVDRPAGRHGTLVIFPRDPYGNPLGPGRSGTFTVSPLPGVKIPGKVNDRGDGSYGVDVVWDPSVTPTPGVVVQQPGRDPALLTPPTGPRPPSGEKDCTEIAEKLLDCLGFDDPDVKKVRVKSVCVEVDLEDPKCRKEDCE
jgi:hypothetical protein